MPIESDVIIAKLMSEFGYTEKRAGEAIQKLQASNPAVQEAFEKWWQEKGLDEQLVIQGYTLQKLIEKHGFNPMNAFLTMDWLIREPVKALRGLSRGRDYVLVSPGPESGYAFERRKRGLRPALSPIPRPLIPCAASAVQVDAHCLGMAIQIDSNVLRRLACLALDHHLGMKLPIGRSMAAPGQFAHLAFFSFILRSWRAHVFGHGSAPLSQ